jgi:hypothetical protein
MTRGIKYTYSSVPTGQTRTHSQNVPDPYDLPVLLSECRTIDRTFISILIDCEALTHLSSRRLTGVYVVVVCVGVGLLFLL